jgi:nitroreductase
VEFKKVIGDRRTIRFFDPTRPVEPAKIQIMLEAANLSSRAINADFAKAIVCYRDELDAETIESLKIPTTTTQFDLAPVYIFWYGTTRFADGAQERLKELVDLGVAPVTHGWSHAYVDEVAFAQVVKPISDDPMANLWMTSVETGISICQAILAGVDEGLGVGLHGFNRDVAKKLLDVPDTWVPMWVLFVGYPAEDRLGGGARPRRPLSEHFFRGDANTPWEDVPGVKEKLRAEGMLQDPMDAEKRHAEIRVLAERFGLPI